MEFISENDRTSDFSKNDLLIITAGSSYLDIDAYACAVAMADLLNLQGANAIAYSQAPCNYSVCSSLTEKSQLLREIPKDFSEQDANYIIVDVSDDNNVTIEDYVPDSRRCSWIIKLTFLDHLETSVTEFDDTLATEWF